MDEWDRWWLPKPLTAFDIVSRREEKDLREWAEVQILGTFAIPKERLMNTKVSQCSGCLQPVSEMAGYVKLSMNKIMHTECYVRNVTGPALSEQEKVLTEGFIRREENLVAEINRLRTTKGESAVVARAEPGAVVFDTKTWDEAAEKICKLAIAHIGPALPLGTLKRYAWFIYSKLRDQKLIQPLSDDKAEETLSEAQERSKKEIEEWLRNK